MLDKNDPTTFHHHYATINGIRMHFVDENTSSKKVLLLVHGWPDLWIGWREQIPYLTQLGYRVIVPTLRGFGETEGPATPEAYGQRKISQDLVELLNYLDVPKVTLIGHDWGGSVVWRMSQFYPDRVIAIASFCTPYTPPSPVEMTLEQIVKIVPNFAYQLYLRSPEAEKDMDQNMGKFFRRFFRPIADMKEPMISKTTGRMAEGNDDYPRHEIIPEKVMNYYIDSYTKQGARGGLNWYKQTHKDYVECKDLDPVIRKPSMMVTADRDKALPPSMAQKMPKFVLDLEMHSVEGSGHWVLWEKPDECNSHLKNFLAKVYSNFSKL